MMRRVGGNVALFQGEATPASQQLAQDGYVVVRGVFTSDELDELRDEVARVFDEMPADRGRPPEQYRYAGLNHSASIQRAIGHPDILATIEPLLGGDCHVIANTLWNNPPEFAGGPWHCDAGPHVPRPEGVLGTTGFPIRCLPSAPTSTSATATRRTARQRRSRGVTDPAGCHRSARSPTQP